MAVAMDVPPSRLRFQSPQPALRTVPRHLRASELPRAPGRGERRLAAALAAAAAARSAGRGSFRHRWPGPALRRLVVRAAQDSEENRLWQRAFEVERERAELLGLCLEEPPSSTDEGSWQDRFQALRRKTEAAEAERRAKLVEAAEKERAAEAEAAAAEQSPHHHDAVLTEDSQQEPPAAAKEEHGSPDPKDEGAERIEEAASDEEAEDGSEEEEIPKVFSLFNLPPNTDDLGEDIVDDAIGVITDTEFPALAAFLGLSNSEDEMPSIDKVRDRLGLASSEMRKLFVEELASARSYGGRVCRFCGRLGQESSAPRSLLDQLNDRVERVEQPGEPALEVFLQQGEEDAEEDQVRLFVFLRSDLPFVQGEEAVELSMLNWSLGVLVFCLCGAQLFTQTNVSQELMKPLEVLPWDSDVFQLMVDEVENVLPIWPLVPSLFMTLGTGLLARRVVADRSDVEITSFSLPSLSFGHLGSTYIMNKMRPSRGSDFDLAAAAPVCSLATSAALVALGLQQVRSSDFAPLQIPALQFPASLAAFMGYSIPIQHEDPLLTLSSKLEALAPTMPLVPVDAFLLSGSLGLVASATSLLPVAGFDGHQMVRSAFGLPAAGFLEFVSLSAMCLEVGRDDIRGMYASEVILIWMVQLFLGRRTDEVLPPQDNVTPVGLQRQLATVSLLGLSAAVLLPAEAWDYIFKAANKEI